jgi:hypothetical protein
MLTLLVKNGTIVPRALMHAGGIESKVSVLPETGLCKEGGC